MRTLVDELAPAAAEVLLIDREAEDPETPAALPCDACAGAGLRYVGQEVLKGDKGIMFRRRHRGGAGMLRPGDLGLCLAPGGMGLCLDCEGSGLVELPEPRGDRPPEFVEIETLPYYDDTRSHPLRPLLWYPAEERPARPDPPSPPPIIEGHLEDDIRRRRILKIARAAGRRAREIAARRDRRLAEEARLRHDRLRAKLLQEVEDWRSGASSFPEVGAHVLTVAGAPIDVGERVYFVDRTPDGAIVVPECEASVGAPCFGIAISSCRDIGELVPVVRPAWMRRDPHRARVVA